MKREVFSAQQLSILATSTLEGGLSAFGNGVSVPVWLLWQQLPKRREIVLHRDAENFSGNRRNSQPDLTSLGIARAFEARRLLTRAVNGIALLAMNQRPRMNLDRLFQRYAHIVKL